MDFTKIKLKLASPEEIKDWSHGEVLKPETINYRTQRPEQDGLFSERIFGPTTDWECYCGKYRKIRYKGIVCDRCGVEVTRSIVRRERMGHITLATPVAHIWFLRGFPSKIATLLNVSLPDIEKVVYFANYIVMEVDEEAKTEAMKRIESEFRSQIKSASLDEEKDRLRELRDREKLILKTLANYRIISELEYRELSLKFGEVFKAGIGAGAIQSIFEQLDVEMLGKELEAEVKLFSVSGTEKDNTLQKRKLVRRLRLVKNLLKSNIKPEWMCITVLPIIPPALRPMVQLDGGRFATSDLNDLYRRVINRNNRLKHLLELRAPEVITRNEKRMLQEAVDALIDNAMRRGQAITTASTGQKRALKSLADMLKGKQGRFRQNLLGKRVDYSGRSVIVIGPELNINQCGLPKHMALELFKPFVIHKLIDKGFAYNIKSAGVLIEQEAQEVWEALEEVIKNKRVLLNRAPTLHRLGIQAFKPVLHEGKAIRIPALPTRAFNADFDGDQMAVHVPITDAAQKEARELMDAAKGILKPSSGEPVATPHQDMVLGAYFLTTQRDNMRGEGKIFASEEETLIALEQEVVDLQAKIKVRIHKNKTPELLETTVGRIIFNDIFPEDYQYINRTVAQGDLHAIEADMLDRYGEEKTVAFLDDLKNLGFLYAMRSGISFSIRDIRIPPEKKEIIKKAEYDIAENMKAYEQGLLTLGERRSKAIEIWYEVKTRIGDLTRKVLKENNPVRIMIDSKARGNWDTINQLMGMRGLFVNPAREIIELPVKNSFKEGLDVLEYFISTHGARKGLVDTALNTASSGYLTRRLVDVAQDVVIRDKDCKDTEGYYVFREDGAVTGESLGKRIKGRINMGTVKDESGKIVIKKNALFDNVLSAKVDELSLDKIKVRSLITCRLRSGVCQMCYGYDLGRNKLVALGEAVGIVTAQSIGEPGTQLTMRTFHTGGVAGGADITVGLPRVEDIFEGRTPKNPAILADVNGKIVAIDDIEKQQKMIKVEVDGDSDDKNGIREYTLPIYAVAYGAVGDTVKSGQQLSDGYIDLKELYRLSDDKKMAVARYIIREIQSIYFTAGEIIHDKHVELIIRQMFSRVQIVSSGDTELLPGDILEVSKVLNENDAIRDKKGKEAKYDQLLLGITKVSLTTESFLSAASFQETARVLIDAAISGKVDYLRGLKENVIIGRLIPAGTGYRIRMEGELA